MSKKQREKVEDEVRFHRAQLVRPQGTNPGTGQSGASQGLASAAQGAQATETSPDSSVFDQQQTPSSSNQAVPFLNGGYTYPEELTSYTPNGYAYTATPATIQFEMSTDYVDSTTFEQRQQMDPTPDTNGLLSTTATTTTTVVPASSLASHLDLLAKTVSDAHSRTCLYTTEHIQDLTRKPLDISRVMLYKNMAHEELWLDCAQKLTQVIQQIIEFAKMVPGFMKLSQDDQIVLLKAGSFELCVLRMSRYFDVPTGLVLYNDSLLPMDAFITQETLEIKLVNNAFNFVRSIAEMKLTETELALYSAYVLLAPDRPGLKGVPEITRLSTAILKSLRYELDKTHEQPYKGDVSVFDSLVAKLPSLREVSLLHMDALAKFRRSVPHLEFPALHKELFSVDV
ncbi:hormone receptor hr3, putative [Ixodes scapularis]|uniref:Hormone receptor hr3, putative n=4 Tax=Ixodes TaxID=6944 RepID=B7PY20_IXOSC|nr:hormone receptor hr3, putative [Ixodes scapularis]|eukprot:XP_002402389.1 hormone receptor hr3, putative [Ixodes scapularis]